MFPRIPWELLVDPLESAEHILGVTALDQTIHAFAKTHFQDLNLCFLDSNLRTADNSLAVLWIEASCQVVHTDWIRRGTNSAKPTRLIEYLL
jgi:hypothetical protein